MSEEFTPAEMSRAYHESMVRLAADEAAAAREGAAHYMGELRRAVMAAVEAGISESETARLAGVTRMTVRSWLGKS